MPEDRSYLPLYQRVAIQEALREMCAEEKRKNPGLRGSGQGAVGDLLGVKQQTISKAVSKADVGPVVAQRLLDFKKITMGDLVARYGAPPVVMPIMPAGPWVDKLLRYPPMFGAIAMGRAMKMPESFLAEFIEAPHEGAERATAEDWWAMLKNENRLRELRENDPEFRKREDARDERKTTELEEELTPKMPGKTAKKSPPTKRKK